MRTAALVPAPSAFSARDLQRGREIPALQSALPAPLIRALADLQTAKVAVEQKKRSGQKLDWRDRAILNAARKPAAQLIAQLNEERGE